MASGDIRKLIDMLLTQDGENSELDADLLDGKEGSYYTNANNLNAGTVPVERLSGTYNIDISGNAATATNADTLDGQHGSYYRNASNLNAGTVPTARLSGTYNIDISGNAATASNADKLDGHDSSYFAASSHNHDSRYVQLTDYEDSDILDKLKHVDGSGSGLDADTLDGQHGSYYRNASNLNAGTVPTARLSGTYNINISGNAATATNADKWDGGHKYISSANPSGGSNGDVWFKY